MSIKLKGKKEGENQFLLHDRLPFVCYTRVESENTRGYAKTSGIQGECSDAFSFISIYPLTFLGSDVLSKLLSEVEREPAHSHTCVYVHLLREYRRRSLDMLSSLPAGTSRLTCSNHFSRPKDQSSAADLPLSCDYIVQR